MRKMKTKNYLKTGLLLFFIALITTNCEKDEFDKEEIQNHHHSISKKVNLKDFPQVLNYLEQQTGKELKINVKHSTRPNFDSTKDGDAITVLSIDTNNVTQNTDENNKSNFALKSKVENNSNTIKLATYNYIIIEYGNQFYSYITEYEYDLEWVASQTPGQWDFSTYTGTIRFFNLYGLFVEEITYAEGIGQITATRHPCDEGGSGDDPIGDPIPDNSDYDPFAGSGGGTTWSVTCGCEPAHSGGNSNTQCNCTKPDIIYLSVRSIGLRHPCDEEGNTTSPPLVDEECFLPNGDPISCENPNLPLTQNELEQNYYSLLGILSDNNPDVWTQYAIELLWLGEHKEEATDILYYLLENDYSQNAFDFIMPYAIDLLINDADVDFEENIINLLNGREECLYNLLKETDLYKETLGLFENNSDYHITLIHEDGCSSPLHDACTSASELSEGCITIYIQTYLENLDFIATIFHEAIHAEIFKYVDQYHAGLDPEEREQLLYYYFYYQSENNNTLATANAQHQYMADNFVKPIARTIRELDNNNYPLEYYMGFGWEGLKRYGYDGYYDNGNWVSLTSNAYDTYIANMNIVLNNTNFGDGCE